MVQLSPRDAYMKRNSPRQPDPLIEYEVLDPNHKPDLNGELAGGTVYRRDGKEYVMLTEQQARFYLDGGAIQAVAKPDK